MSWSFLRLCWYESFRCFLTDLGALVSLDIFSAGKMMKWKKLSNLTNWKLSYDRKFSEIAGNMAGSKENLIVPAEVILLWISNSNSSLARSSSSGDDFIRCSSASESANSVPTRFRIVGTGSPGSSGISGGSSPVSSPRKRTSHEIELKPF